MFGTKRVILVLLAMMGAAVLLAPSVVAAQTSSPTKSTEGNSLGSKEVTLKIEGDSKTQFSGVCSVGEEKETVDGQVPQSFAFDLGNGQKLECEIRKRNKDSSVLKSTLIDGDNNKRSVNRVNARETTIKLSYARGSMFFSASSVSASSSSGGRASLSKQVVSSSGKVRLSASSSSTK